MAPRAGSGLVLATYPGGDSRLRRSVHRLGRLLPDPTEARVIPAIPAGQSVIELGRHLTTEAEIEARFVTDAQFAASTTRGQVWTDWQAATALLRAQVPVAEAWLGGSFTTTKLDPDDVDCLYVIDTAQIVAASADLAKARIIGQFASAKAVRTATQWRVDTFVLAWRPVPDPQQATFEDIGYFQSRGYWDDWWLRQRMVLKGSPPTRDDTLPRRGYLEVILDGLS